MGDGCVGVLWNSFAKSVLDPVDQRDFAGL